MISRKVSLHFFSEAETGVTAGWGRNTPFALLAVPLSVIALGNYHLFEGTQQVSSCLRCHVMLPIANDMMDMESVTLAARALQKLVDRDEAVLHLS